MKEPRATCSASLFVSGASWSAPEAPGEVPHCFVFDASCKEAGRLLQRCEICFLLTGICSSRVVCRIPLLAMPNDAGSSCEPSSKPGKFEVKTITGWIDSGKLTIQRVQRHVDYLDGSAPYLQSVLNAMQEVMLRTFSEH